MKVIWSVTWGTVAVVAVIAVILLSGTYVAFEKYTSTSEFCGASCHTMTEQYTAWQSSTHHADNSAHGTQAECVDCHFLPGEKSSFNAKMEGLRHLAAYLYNPAAPLPIRPVIKDGSCLQSGCHAQAELAVEEIQFAENVRFLHEPHFETGALEGQDIACDTCHFKVTEEKHFEVPTEICALCHLKLEQPTLDIATNESVVIGGEVVERISFGDRPTINFNEGLSKCETCHVIPTRSLQGQLSASDSNVRAITHQTIQETGVACESCHFEVVSGHGEVQTGDVASNGCLRCHNRSDELLATATDGRLMHDQHVATSSADCFDCHTVIEHRNRTDHLDFVREDCTLCHENEHQYQKLLLAGTPVADGVQATPHLMFNVNTNCMGCHLKREVSNGHIVRTGAPETCAACHTPDHAKMLENWREQLDEEVEMAGELEQEAMDALAAAADAGISDEIRLEAGGMIVEGQRFLDIVRVGNGVHNKKYAITILDEAFVKFEDAIDLLDQ